MWRTRATYTAEGQPTILLAEILTDPLEGVGPFIPELSNGCVEVLDLPVRNVPADNPSLTINSYSMDGDDCDGQIADFQVFSIYDPVSNNVSAVVFLDRYTVDSANEAMVRAIARNN